MRLAIRSAVTRRRMLKTVSATALATVSGIARPYVSFAADRPLITHGIQSGDVSVDSGMVWARADRPARMLVEAATSDSFDDVLHAAYVDVLPETDCTAKVLLEGCRPARTSSIASGSRICRRPPSRASRRSAAFAPRRRDRRAITFVWSGDSRGKAGASTSSAAACAPIATMHDNRPDFFIHSGDNIYADCPIQARLKLPNGGVWNNLVTEEKSSPPRRCTNSAATTNTICSTRTCAPSTREVPMLRPVGRSRGHQRLVAGRAADARRAARKHYASTTRSVLAARVEPCLPRIHADARDPGRAGPRLPQDPLWAAARRVHARHAQLSRPECRRHAASYGPDAYFLGPRRWPGSSASC